MENTRVTITNIDIPVGELVGFLFKLSVALTLNAALILGTGWALMAIVASAK